MEKRTPHCKLAVVKAMLAAGKVRTTVLALAGGAALGFGFEEIIGVVAALSLPAKDASRRSVSQAHGLGRRFDRVL